MQREIFISYVEEDEALALQICDALEVQSPELCWIACRDCTPGENYRLQINEQIKTCRMMVVINSKHALDSEWLPREVDRAQQLKKRVLPVVVDNCALGEQLELLLSGVHRFMMKSDRAEEKIKQFCKLTHDLLKGIAPAASRSKASRPKVPEAGNDQPELPAVASVAVAAEEVVDEPVHEQPVTPPGAARSFWDVVRKIQEEQEAARQASAAVAAASCVHAQSSMESTDGVCTVESATAVRTRMEIDELFTRFRSGMIRVMPAPESSAVSTPADSTDVATDSAAAPQSIPAAEETAEPAEPAMEEEPELEAAPAAEEPAPPEPAKKKKTRKPLFLTVLIIVFAALILALLIFSSSH